ncbi:hypothetical protein BRADI_3g44603v3 [Brachypodium distachyon]|uniref:Uncharacterized protein n=1 Tax=Brachypodium distachyon TaxID=15368 RepID=A0A2K2D381_BRADI|nr:hypothetical protein BRADI_3g44603v3 [Brachypodium distachyon]
MAVMAAPTRYRLGFASSSGPWKQTGSGRRDFFQGKEVFVLRCKARRMHYYISTPYSAGGRAHIYTCSLGGARTASRQVLLLLRCGLMKLLPGVRAGAHRCCFFQSRTDLCPSPNMSTCTYATTT